MKIPVTGNGIGSGPVSKPPLRKNGFSFRVTYFESGGPDYDGAQDLPNLAPETAEILISKA